MTDHKIKTILLFVDTTNESIKAAEYAIKLAKNYASKIIALNVVNKNVINQLERFSGKRRSEVEIEVEEHGWTYLYHIEEMAKDEGIPIMIAQEHGLNEEIIDQYREKHHADMIIFGYQKNTTNLNKVPDKTIEQTIDRCKCCVLVVQ